MPEALGPPPEGMKKTPRRRPAERTPEPPAPVGRPSDYKSEYCAIAADACARGATIQELADLFGVARWTVNRWRLQHEEFRAAITVGRDVADGRVEESLYERAVGYSYNSVKIMQYEGTPVIIPYVEHVPPDVGAQKHWLANRQPKQWRTEVNHMHSIDPMFVTALQTITPTPGAVTAEPPKGLLPPGFKPREESEDVEAA